MTKIYKFTDKFIEEFHEFVNTDTFSELLGIVWRYGHFHVHDNKFELSHKNREIIERFSILAKGATPVKSRYRSDKGFHEWHCNIHGNHPLLKKIRNMGWQPITHQERTYPKGDFNHSIFIKTYILMRHDVGIIREKTPKGILTRPRLRIHGSVDVLQHITQHLHTELGVGLKKLQTDWKVARAKTIYYQSKRDIPLILEYVGAWEALEKFNSFELGYEKTPDDIISV